MRLRSNHRCHHRAPDRRVCAPTSHSAGDRDGSFCATIAVLRTVASPTYSWACSAASAAHDDDRVGAEAAGATAPPGARPGRRPLRGTAFGRGPCGGRRAVAHDFSRAFSQACGESPHQYLLTRRLERAAALLWTTDWSVASICFAVGWSRVGSFTTSFRRMHGETPTHSRTTFPPAAAQLRIPRCVAMAYVRPHNRTFREDGEGPVTSRSAGRTTGLMSHHGTSDDHHRQQPVLGAQPR